MNLLGAKEPTDRVVIPVQAGDRFAKKIAKELNQPWNTDVLISHKFHPDQDYDPKLLLEGKAGFHDERRNRLKGKSVYLVASHKTWEPSLLFERIGHTASLCAENGAKEIFLVWTNIRNSGNHLRPGTNNRPTPSDLEKYDGKSLGPNRIAKHFKIDGIKKVLTVHTHSKNFIEAFGEVYLNDINRGKEVFLDLPIAPLLAHHLIVSGKVKGTGSDAVFVSTDEGSKDLGVAVIENLQALNPKLKDLSWVKFRKERDKSTGFLKNIYEDSTSENYNGHLTKTKFICDDIVRSFMSMYGVIEKMGGENFVMFATHAHLTGRSQSLLRSDRIKEIIFTNTMAHNLEDPHYSPSLFKKTTVLKIGKYFAHAIVNILEEGNDPDEFYKCKSEADMKRIENLYSLRKTIV